VSNSIAYEAKLKASRIAAFLNEAPPEFREAARLKADALYIIRALGEQSEELRQTKIRLAALRDERRPPLRTKAPKPPTVEEMAEQIHDAAHEHPAGVLVFRDGPRVAWQPADAPEPQGVDVLGRWTAGADYGDVLDNIRDAA
jgi:hypothetical protein